METGLYRGYLSRFLATVEPIASGPRRFVDSCGLIAFELPAA